MHQIFVARPPTYSVVESYDEFIGVGLDDLLANLPPHEVNGMAIRLGGMRISKPLHAEEPGVAPSAMTARVAYERGVMYHSMIRCDVLANDKVLLPSEFLW